MTSFSLSDMPLQKMSAQWEVGSSLGSSWYGTTTSAAGSRRIGVSLFSVCPALGRAFIPQVGVWQKGASTSKLCSWGLSLQQQVAGEGWEVLISCISGEEIPLSGCWGQRESCVLACLSRVESSFLSWGRVGRKKEVQIPQTVPFLTEFSICS